MSRAPVGPYIEVTIRETLKDGTTRFVSRWVNAGAKGWSSADNLGRDPLPHRDEAAARTALAGWMRSQAAVFAEAPADEPVAHLVIVQPEKVNIAEAHAEIAARFPTVLAALADDDADLLG